MSTSPRPKPSKRYLRFSLLAAPFALVLAAQETTIRTRVNLVVAPATVTDASGRFVNGLSEPDFEVLDNGAARKVRVDHSDFVLTPISLVICVQANNDANPALAKIRKTGSLIDTMITGDRGEAALLRVNEEIQVVQEFTAEGVRIRDAFRSLKTSGSGAKSLDAVEQAIRMLHERPGGRRKIVILIAEAKDRGSEAKLPDVLRLAQQENVTVYPLTFSVHATPWTAKPEDIKPGDGMDLIRVVGELTRLGKSNTAEELARFTGGRKLPFLTLGGLEAGLSRLGEELHSQYLISFAPAEVDNDGAFHVLSIRVKGRPELKVVSRPGYWPF